jgi:DNA-binding transcriptional MocR family regulator
MARSDAWRSLSGAGVKIYLELRCRFTIRGDGRANNNGELSLSLDEAARLLGLSKSTVARALAELEAAGFIAMTKAGHWYGRKATQYRITDEPWNGQPPTREWKERERKANATPAEKWRPEMQDWEPAND